MNESPRPIADRRNDRRGGSAVARSVAPALAVALVLVTAALLALAGCTPQKRYRVLSFFFDGVPDPNAPRVLLDEEGNPISSETVSSTGVRVFMHQPFRQPNGCASCHASTGRFEDFDKVPQGVCLKCHQSVIDAFPVMHGPVASVQCLFCHAPHESTEPALLRQPAPKICTQCHVPELLPADPPEHLAPDSKCLSCHVGHGSQKHGLLRADFAITPADSPDDPMPPAPQATDPSTKGASP